MDDADEFLEELRDVFGDNPARAVLMARKEPDRLPPGLARHAASLQRSMQSSIESAQMDQMVRTQLGGMGIFPGMGGGGGFDSGVDPDEAIFMACMGMVQKHGGEVPPELRSISRVAPGVVKGTTHWSEALRATPGGEAMVQMVPMLEMMGMSAMIRLTVIINAALAVPRNQIDALLASR